MKIDMTNLNGVRPLRPTGVGSEQKLAAAQEVQETFRQFVGESFYGQLLKSMRTTVGKPAYFHGGRAEEVFRGQLDQTLAEHMTEANSDQIADPMFRQQFPQQAEVLEAAAEENRPSTADLLALRRR
ncbi:MAG: rod-binding protein [Planctomycetota bacterium]